jgi:hypothetical protein
MATLKDDACKRIRREHINVTYSCRVEYTAGFRGLGLRQTRKERRVVVLVRYALVFNTQFNFELCDRFVTTIAYN